jgi:hypothetical protein
MEWGSHRERVVAAIRASSQALDDDQLADWTSISPRKRVNQICRELRDAGLLQRRISPNGKIVNEWLGEQREGPEHAAVRSVQAADVSAPGGGAVGLSDRGLPAAQRHKVLADAFKLAWISRTLYPRPDLVLCLSDRRAAAPFLPGGRSWAARAFQDLGISVTVVTLPKDLRQCVLDAQHRQYRLYLHRNLSPVT